MTASEARALLERIGDRQLDRGDVVFVDTIRARVLRGADLMPRQAEWLRRLALATQALTQ